MRLRLPKLITTWQRLSGENSSPALSSSDQRPPKRSTSSRPLAPLRRAESIRLGAGRLFLAVRTGTGLPPELFSVGAVVEQVDDPLVRLSFLHARGAALAFAGRYEEALAAITEHISELEKYRLVFALPHSYLQKALAFQGLRKYREAQNCLDTAVKFAPGESYVTSSASTIRTLICLDSGDVEEAQRQLGSEIYDLPLPGLRGECLACRR